MARQPTTRLQVSGYRFLVRRMEHALVRRDVRMIHDPMRSQSRSIVVGTALASVLVAGCAILAFLRPNTPLGKDDGMVMGKESGALYVHIKDVLHPVLNLASARLISGNSGNPKVVKDTELAKSKRGPLVGIPGAPSIIPEPLKDKDTIWSVCDVASPPPSSTVTTTVIAGQVKLDNGAMEMPSDRYALVVVNNTQYFLLYDGKRAAVDLSSPVVKQALRLEGASPRPISLNVLNAIPEVPAIAPPVIPDAGQPSDMNAPGVLTGSVVKVNRAGSVEYYVVLKDGVQRISEVTADLIRFANSQGAQDIPSVAPDVVSRTTAMPLPVQSYPDHAGKAVPVPEKSVLCSSWTPGQAGTQEHATTKLLIGNALPLKSDQVPSVLAQADKDGPNVDAIYLPPGRCAFVTSTGLGGDPNRPESWYLISDTGVRYGIANPDAAKSLGLLTEATPKPAAAPWPIIGLLPPGPRLSKADAFVVHDGMPPDKTGLSIQPPEGGQQPPPQ